MQEGHDFFGRIKTFLETFGPGGATVMIVVAFLFIGLALWRGTGFVLFMLLLSFMFGTIQHGGIVFALALMRWFCLALLAVACVRRFQFPNATMLFFVFHVLLGMAFAFVSPAPLWSLQKGVLKLVIVIFLPIAATTYFLSIDDIIRFFKLCIFAAAAWTLTNLILAREFLQAREMRFSFGAIQQGAAVDAGAYLAPIIVWGIAQSRRRALRVSCVVLLVPFILLLLLSGKRAAFAGQVIIASDP